MRDEARVYRFCCGNVAEYRRATSFFSKEPGTLEWLRSELRPGDVFYDIGANIGVFSIFGGYSVGPQGVVYAFEPHVGNAASLLRNLALNDLSSVRVLSCALHDRPGFFEFSYGDWSAGTAFSEIAEREQVGSVGSELKYATSVDALIDDGSVGPPDVIKLDIDGHEPEVLRGMEKLLTGDRRPRALQSEVNPEVEPEVIGLLSDYRYRLVRRHVSEGNERLIAAGTRSESVPYNGIFRSA